MQTRPARSEVHSNETWNLDDLYPTLKEWEADYHRVEQELPGIAAFKGRLGESAATLRQCLEIREALHQRLIRVGTYASLRASEDGTDPENQALAARAGSLGARVGAETSFIRSEILALPIGVLDRFLRESQDLDDFRPYLQELEEYRPFLLSPDTEAALAALGETLSAPSTIYNRAKISDLRFPPLIDEQGRETEISFASYEWGFEDSPDTDQRRRAYDHFSRGLDGFKNTFAATFATEVKRSVVMSRLRGFRSTEEMLLQPQRVSLQVYHNVLDIIQQELAPHMRRFQNLRKRVLGLNELRHCDLKAPLDPDFSPEVTYAEAADIILQALAVLGPEYTAIMEAALRDRWIDLANNVGKGTGAFCAGPYGVHPYILITWANQMRSAFVLTHELGHAGHGVLSQRNHRLTTSRAPMFFIEAPSTCNELILGNHLLATTTDRRMRRWVILQLMGTFHHNFVTHLLEAELQRRVYARAEADQPVTASLLCELKGAVLSDFFGDVLVVDDAARLTWTRQPHYYFGLYPYTYAAGLCAGVAVAESIRAEGPPAVGRWLQALKAGGVLPPQELMQLAGVDMSRPDPLRGAVAYVGRLVDELEESFSHAD